MRDCPRLEKLIHILEWARIEDFVPAWPGVGRPPKERGALANGFVAKAELGLPTTVALIDRLTVDRALRRICDFPRWKKLVASALRTRASIHDSQAAIPLSLMTARRVTNLYDVMDAAYCSAELREHCRELRKRSP